MRAHAGKVRYLSCAAGCIAGWPTPAGGLGGALVAEHRAGDAGVRAVPVGAEAGAAGLRGR